MAENEVQSADGRVWTADEFALELGHTLDAVEFAEILQNKFKVHGYERMQDLWAKRDYAKRRGFSGTLPEGADINDAMQ